MSLAPLVALLSSQWPRGWSTDGWCGLPIAHGCISGLIFVFSVLDEASSFHSSIAVRHVLFFICCSLLNATSNRSACSPIYRFSAIHPSVLLRTAPQIRAGTVRTAAAADTMALPQLALGLPQQRQELIEYERRDAPPAPPTKQKHVEPAPVMRPLAFKVVGQPRARSRAQPIVARRANCWVLWRHRFHCLRYCCYLCQ